MQPLLVETETGLYCPAGDFFIDPWRPVRRAVITHAHSDHAHAGSQSYLCAKPGLEILRLRLGADAQIDSLDYGQSLQLGSVSVSLHPAGHVLGSAQVRLEERGQVWVVSGDYKTEPDRTCAALEPLRCHTFVTESTFGLPVYRWPDTQEVYDEVNAWWRQNQHDGRTSVVYAYALGKAQRLLAGLDPAIGPILLHGAVSRFVDAYRQAGVALPQAEYADADRSRAGRGRALVIAPPSAMNSPWLRRFTPIATAMASGWMQLRGPRRRRAIDRGFVLSDHADWSGLLSTIQATSAEHVWVTHGYTIAMVRWLQAQGLDARTVRTEFTGEQDEGPEADHEEQVE